MTTHHDPDTVRAWLPIAMSWMGTGAAYLLEHAVPLAALLSGAFTLWQWRRQVLKDRDERRTARELLQRLSDEYATPFDQLDTRPGIRR